MVICNRCRSAEGGRNPLNHMSSGKSLSRYNRIWFNSVRYPIPSETHVRNPNIKRESAWDCNPQLTPCQPLFVGYRRKLKNRIAPTSKGTVNVNEPSLAPDTTAHSFAEASGLVASNNRAPVPEGHVNVIVRATSSRVIARAGAESR